MSRSRAVPLASLVLLPGQWATATSYSRHSSRSPSSMCTQWAAEHPAAEHVVRREQRRDAQPVGGQQLVALGRGLRDVHGEQQVVLTGRLAPRR